MMAITTRSSISDIPAQAGVTEGRGLLEGQTGSVFNWLGWSRAGDCMGNRPVWELGDRQATSQNRWQGQSLHWLCAPVLAASSETEPRVEWTRRSGGCAGQAIALSSGAPRRHRG